MANKKQSKTAKQASKSKGTAKQHARQERGGWLSFILALILLHSIFATVMAFSYRKAAYSGSTSWVLPVLTLCSIAGIIAAIGMWYWKKWGIYLYAAISVVQAVVHILLTGSTLVVFYDLIPVAILGYVITLQSKSDLFE